MNVKIYLYKYFLLLLISLFSIESWGQQTLYSTHPSPQASSYYINLNTEDIDQPLYQLPDTKLCLKYEDRAAKNGTMAVSIVNWQNKIMGSVKLSKAFGLNYYDVDLQRIADTWEFESIYYCRYTDDEGKKNEVSFKIQKPTERKNPSVSVFVNPVTTHCDNISQSYINFLGEVAGGKAPYRITWYVLNATQSELLFLPKEQFLNVGDQSPMISVDAFLDYHVLLYVEDACGTVGKQMVHVRCEEKSDKINTIFVQPLDNSSILKSIN